MDTAKAEIGSGRISWPACSIILARILRKKVAANRSSVRTGKLFAIRGRICAVDGNAHDWAQNIAGSAVLGERFPRLCWGSGCVNTGAGDQAVFSNGQRNYRCQLVGADAAQLGSRIGVRVHPSCFRPVWRVKNLRTVLNDTNYSNYNPLNSSAPHTPRSFYRVPGGRIELPTKGL
jgi:hypothetical protein